MSPSAEVDSAGSVVAAVIRINRALAVASVTGYFRRVVFLVSAARSGNQGKQLRAGSYISIELNTKTAVPEWGGEPVFVMMEDDAWLDADGWKFFQPRQTEWFVIR